MSKKSEDPLLSTIKNIRRLAAESEDLSQQTCEKLNEQGEAISRFSQSANNVEENLKVSSKLIKGIQSFGGRMSGWWSDVWESKPASANPQVNSFVKDQETIPNETRSYSSVGEDEALDEISKSLNRMKERALLISSSIREQNSTLSKVTNQVDVAREKVSGLHSQIKKKF